MAHLTCVGPPRAELRGERSTSCADGHRERARAARRPAARARSVRRSRRRASATPTSWSSCSRARLPVLLGGACYPEGHIECRERDDDLRHLDEKVDAGLDFLVTQLFFDNAVYFDFVERARAAGIKVPIIPGHHADHQLRADRALHADVRRDDPERLRCELRRARRAIPRRSASSASRTRRCSASSCSPAACPASTSTRSTAHRPPRRSGARLKRIRPSKKARLPGSISRPSATRGSHRRRRSGRPPNRSGW